MPTVDFEEVEDSFNHIWMGNYEDYFYQKSWEILTEQGLTSYDDDGGYVKVILRAAALYLVFGEFSQVAFGETIYASQVVDMVDGFDGCVDNYDFILGQLYSKINKEDEICESRHNAIYELVMAEKEAVISALDTGFDQHELAVVMYAVVEIDSYLDDECICRNEDGTTEEIDAESIDCYEDFWDMLDKHDVDINSDCRGSLVRGYSWLSGGAYPIAYFD